MVWARAPWCSGCWRTTRRSGCRFRPPPGPHGPGKWRASTTSSSAARRLRARLPRAASWNGLNSLATSTAPHANRWRPSSRPAGRCCLRSSWRAPARCGAALPPAFRSLWSPPVLRSWSGAFAVAALTARRPLAGGWSGPGWSWRRRRNLMPCWSTATWIRPWLSWSG